VTARLRATILGCGSSGGVPRIGNSWGACDPAEPRNTRRRCSLLVERLEGGRTTRVLIDTSPDLRAQLLDAGVGELDAVVYTHAHADHVHGIDDLRVVVQNRGARLPVWADAETALGLGFYLSVSGIATFRSAGGLREIFAAAPIERILVETDSPYLAPQPHRGRRNEPAYVADTARAAAAIWGMDYPEFAAQTSANFDRLFAKAAAWGPT
jgi:phosphoribosyl 1,2-cyclic phosphate phosphodiesterase